jgi:hypothetical protein
MSIQATWENQKQKAAEMNLRGLKLDQKSSYLLEVA